MLWWRTTLPRAAGEEVTISDAGEGAPSLLGARCAEIRGRTIMIGFDLGIILSMRAVGADAAGSLVTGAAGWRGRGHMLFVVVVSATLLFLPSFLRAVAFACLACLLACVVGLTSVKRCCCCGAVVLCCVGVVVLVGGRDDLACDRREIPKAGGERGGKKNTKIILLRCLRNKRIFRPMGKLLRTFLNCMTQAEPGW